VPGDSGDEWEPEPEPEPVPEVPTSTVSASYGSGADVIDWVRIPTYEPGLFDQVAGFLGEDAEPMGGFEMSRSEVTLDQYRACVEAGACEAPPSCTCSVWEESSTTDIAMNCVTFDMANRFARWVGGRLATKDEWRYAAKGGQDFRYYAGSDNADLAGWFEENADGHPYPVCGKKRNGYGLCDMSGNLAEWVADPHERSNDSLRYTLGGSYVGKVTVMGEESGILTFASRFNGIRVVRD